MEENHYHTSAQDQQTDATERLQANLNNASSLTVIPNIYIFKSYIYLALQEPT